MGDTRVSERMEKILLGLLKRNDRDKWGTKIQDLIVVTESNEKWAIEWRAMGYLAPISWKDSMRVGFRNSLGKLEKQGLVKGVGHRWVYNKKGVIRWKLTEDGVRKATEIRERIKDYFYRYEPIVLYTS